MMRRAPIALIACLGIAAAARPAHASPLEMFGFGGRSPGMAATGVADAAGFDSVYLNPAGLADVHRKRMSVGTLVGAFDLKGIDRTVDAAVAAELGGALPIPLGGVMKSRVGLGLGFYVPTAVLLTARAPEPGTPYFALLENRAQVVGIQIGLGVKITDRWSAGAGVLALSALKGTIHVSVDAAGRFTSISEQQLIAQYAPIFGTRYKLSTVWQFGATLRFPSRSDYDIDVTNDLAKALPVTLPELRFAGAAQYDPLTVAAEASWLARKHLRVNLQLAWEHWSAFPLPTENPVAAMPPQASPGFHDTVVPRAAVEWTHQHGKLELDLRAGYFFAWSPAPEMKGMQAFIDNHRHVFSLGLGLSAPSSKLPFCVDAWFQAHVLQPRTTDRPDPGTDVKTSGAIYAGGLMVGVDL
jgi:long-chain fatty acid transport protein